MHTINEQKDVEQYQHDQGHYMVYGDLHVNCDLVIDTSISIVGSLFIEKEGSVKVEGDLLITGESKVNPKNNKQICIQADRLIRADSSSGILNKKTNNKITRFKKYNGQIK